MITKQKIKDAAFKCSTSFTLGDDRLIEQGFELGANWVLSQYISNETIKKIAEERFPIMSEKDYLDEGEDYPYKLYVADVTSKRLIWQEGAEEIEKYTQKKSQQQSIAFAEWIVDNDLVFRTDGNRYWFDFNRQEEICITTEQLYNLFLQANQK